MTKQVLKAGNSLTNHDESENYFKGVLYLYGKDAFRCFQRAHVCVVGVGGVGSWIVEALARSGIGNLTLVDPDKIASSNMNRQLQALESTLGQIKVYVLAERIKQINPTCRVNVKEMKVTIENPQELFANQNFDYMVDAIDDMFAKTALIAYCREKQIPLVTVGGAGGQMDPTCIKVCDLCRTEQEPLLARVRKRLRQKYGFPRGLKPFGIDAVYSTEPLHYPDSYEPSSSNEREDLSFDTASLRFGTSVAVTASFGMTAASVVLRRLAKNQL